MRLRFVAVLALALTTISAFGQAIEPVGTTSPTQQSLLTFSAPGTPGSIAVLTQGAPNLDFNFAPGGSCNSGIVYLPGQTCTVQYTFTPRQPGIRYGGITLTTNTGALLASSYINGTGTGPQLIYTPAMQSSLGSGFNFPIAAAVDSSGNIFVSDIRNNAVKEVTAASGYITVNTLGSGFNGPWGLAVDGNGNVFVGDSGNNAVKEIIKAGGYTIVKTLGSSFNTPRGVAVDGNGNVFVSDSNNNAVKEITAASGYTTINTLGNGFNNPSGVAVDTSGNVFVADNGNNVVKEILAIGGYTTVNTLLSGGNDFIGMAIDNIGNVFVADFGNKTVQEILSAGNYTTVNTLASGLAFIEGVAVDGSGNVYVTLTHQNQVIKLDYADPPSLTFAPTTVGLTSTDSPQSVTFTNNGNANLIFTVPGSSNNPSITPGFTLGGASTCPQLTSSSTAATLTPGASCTDAISFTPVAIGPDNGALLTADNNLNVAGALQSISLNGNGLAIVTSISLSTTASPVFLLNPVTLTAAVTSSGGTPTGSVTFLDGVIPIATVALSSAGTASFTTSNLSFGSHTISAQYSGDSRYSATATTTAIPVAVQDFSLTLTTPSQSILHGGTATYTMSISILGGPVSPADISFVLSGQPDTSAITFSPQSIVTGQRTTLVTLTIQTPDYPVAPWSISRNAAAKVALGAFLLGGLLLPYGSRPRLLHERINRILCVAFLLSVSAGVLALNGCGWGWPTQNYTVTVTASSGALAHSVNATLASHP